MEIVCIENMLQDGSALTPAFLTGFSSNAIAIAKAMANNPESLIYSPFAFLGLQLLSLEALYSEIIDTQFHRLMICTESQSQVLDHFHTLQLLPLSNDTAYYNVLSAPCFSQHQ